MKHIFLLILLCCSAVAWAQTESKDSTEEFKWPAAFRAEDSASLIKLFPNPAKDNVFVTIKNWEANARYNFVLLDGKGRPIKNIILLQAQQLIPLKQSYGKGLLWVEVYKDKQIIGKEKLYVADRY
jgi:hypothetical protein